MANVNRVSIKGWAPFNLGFQEAARNWLGVMNGPVYGVRIQYGESVRGPLNEHGGHTWYYRFEVSGEEALWTSGAGRSVEALARALVRDGCVLSEARAMDLEFDPDNAQWADLLPMVRDSYSGHTLRPDYLLRYLEERSAGTSGHASAPEPARVSIPAGYSNCSNCHEFKECRNKVWVAFDEPIPANLEHGFPEVAGIWSMWCDACVAEKGVEYEREEAPQPIDIVVTDEQEGPDDTHS